MSQPKNVSPPTSVMPGAGQGPARRDRPDPAAAPPDGTLRDNPRLAFRVGLVVGVLLAVATALLVVQNGRSVRMSWLVWDFGAPLWLFLALSAVSGAVLLQLGLFVRRRGRSSGQTGTIEE